LFNKPFSEEIDIHLANLILKDTDKRLTPEIKDEFSKLVKCINPKNNIVKAKYQPRYKIGRHYPIYPNKVLPNKVLNPDYGKYYGALITQPRLIKNTIFKYQNWIDVDQKKGHPTIIYCNATRIGMKLPAYKEYLTNYEECVEDMAEYYTEDPEYPITVKDIKLLFNRTIYGGGHKEWSRTIEEGEYAKDHKGEYIFDKEGYYIEKTSPRTIANADKPHPFYEKYYKDTQKIIKLVYASNQSIADRVCQDIPDIPKNLWKRENRTMSYFCGIIEHEITYQAYKFLYNNDVIQDRHVDWGLDGLTFPSPDITNLTEKFQELNAHVRIKTGFDLVTFVIKPFDDGEILLNSIIQIDNMLVQDNKDLEEATLDKPKHKTFESVAEEFEKTHCKIINKSIFFKETADDNIPMTKGKIITSYEHLTYQKVNMVQGEYALNDKVFIEDWLKGNPNQRVYQNCAVYPNPKLCPKDEYNLWKPFAMNLIEDYEPKPKKLKYILQHIRILCDHDESVFEYICAWIGQMLKHPEVKSGICPTFISLEGAGKGTFLNLLRKMMGSKKISETSEPSRDVWGNFNSQMQNSFLVNLNELSKSETIHSEGKIKALITDSALTINSKGVNQYEIVSYHRFMVTANANDPLTTKKDDRRNLIIRASDELLKNTKYFDRLREYIEDIDVIKTCFEHFISIDNLDKFHTLKVPTTEYQRDMQLTAVCPIERWLEDFVIEKQDEKNIHLMSSEAFILFNEWIAINKVQY
jgi:hypothetical protein